MVYRGEQALALIETKAIVPVIEAADKMLKAADVELIALEAGGSTLCTVFMTGDVASCEAAVKAGAEAAAKIGEVTAKNVMPRPIKAISAIVNSHLLENVPAEGICPAVGLIGTFGVVYLMEAADAMCKAADVELIGYENIYDGYCSVMVKGETDACRTAVDAGVRAVRQLGQEPYSFVTISAPHPDLQKMLQRYTIDGLESDE